MTVLVLVGGWASSAGALSNRIGDLESRQSELRARYEREVVPRVEHDTRNKAQDERLARMEKAIDNLQITADEIKRQINDRRR